MAVKCFFSGVEGKDHFGACVDAGVQHVLTSYYQFYNKGTTDTVKLRKKAHPHLKFLIDSGAHTFIESHAKFAHWTRQDYEKYLEGYVKWIRQNKKYIFAAVELDIDYCLNMNLAGGNEQSPIGSQIVRGWQDKYFRPLEEEGIPVIYVWHVERGMEGWEEMCSKFSYVGLPGEMSKTKDFHRYINVARKFNTKVHGFAATAGRDFTDIGWYSIDSISWKTGEIYGVIIHFDEKREKLIFDQNKAERYKYKSAFEEAGLDPKLIISDKNYKEVTKFNLWSFRRIEKYYQSKFKKRQFYYEHRLPNPQYIRFKASDKVVEWWWNRMTKRGFFEKHSGSNLPLKEIRELLQAFALLQYGDFNRLQMYPDLVNYLKPYIDNIDQLLQYDGRSLQVALGQYLAPKIKKAMSRDVRSWADVFTSRRRKSKQYTMSELEFSSDELTQVLDYD